MIPEYSSKTVTACEFGTLNFLGIKIFFFVAMLVSDYKITPIFPKMQFNYTKGLKSCLIK